MCACATLPMPHREEPGSRQIRQEPLATGAPGVDAARQAAQRHMLTRCAAEGLLIGGIRCENRLLLAPMAGVTDRPFRTLCRRLGAGLAVSEMLSANPALMDSRKSRERADHRGEPGPIAVQIAGSDPAWMAEAARINVGRGAAIIDINLGCPAKKVCKAAAGSALLRDEALVGRILEAVVRAVPVPVTLKTRTGWSPATRNLSRIARIAREAGIALIAVHGRTRACGYGGAAEFDSLRALRAEIDLPLVANGDIDSPERAAAVLAYTGADAVMIGRAAQGRPWLFGEIGHYLATGEHLPPPSPEWVCATLREHLEALYRFYGAARGVRIARKHIGWYARGSAGQRTVDDECLARINRAETPRQQTRAIGALFDNERRRGDAA
jgi:tRNA-dihydrouridine synthase B